MFNFFVRCLLLVYGGRVGRAILRSTVSSRRLAAAAVRRRTNDDGIRNVFFVYLAAGPSYPCIETDTDFDSGWGMFSNNDTVDDFNWSLRRGTTPSFFTGPMRDHTTGSGKGKKSL